MDCSRTGGYLPGISTVNNIDMDKGVLHKSKSIKINALLNIIKQCCNIIFPLITYPYVSRILGSQNLGKYSFSDSIISCFMIAASLGIPTYAIREGARIRNEKNKIRQFSSELFTINIIALVMSCIVLFLLIRFVPRLGKDVLITYILSINIITSILGRDWINAIYEDYVFISARYIFFHLLSVILTFAFVRESADYIKYTVIMLLGNSGGYVANFFYTQKYIPLKITSHINIKKHGKPILYLFCTSVALTIYIKSDITVLGFFRSDSEVGIYTLSSKIYMIIKALLNAAITVTIPRLASYLGSNKIIEYQNLLNKLRKGLCIIVFPVVVGLFFMAEEIILLLGGTEYHSGYIPLTILCIALILAVFSTFYAQGILVVNRNEKHFFAATTISAIVNIVINILFIPQFGMICAALSTLLAELIVVVICRYYSQKDVDLHDDGNMKSVLVGCVIIAIICIIVKSIVLSNTARLLIAVAASAFSYSYILLLMRNRMVLDIYEAIKKKYFRYFQ